MRLDQLHCTDYFVHFFMATSPHSKARQSDNTAAYLLLAVVTIVVCGFMAWMYWQYKERENVAVAYTTIGPIVVRGAEFSLRASVAVQTRQADSDLIGGQAKNIDFSLQSALIDLDPLRVRQADGLSYVQQTLKTAVSMVTGAQVVEDVLLTDFIIQEN